MSNSKIIKLVDIMTQSDADTKKLSHLIGIAPPPYGGSQFVIFLRVAVVYNGPQVGQYLEMVIITFAPYFLCTHATHSD